MRRIPSSTRRITFVLACLACLLAPLTAFATCGNGIVDGGESCDLGASNGDAAACCTAACELRAAGSTCRPAVGVCAVADTCDGVTPQVPDGPWP